MLRSAARPTRRALVLSVFALLATLMCSGATSAWSSGATSEPGRHAAAPGAPARDHVRVVATSPTSAPEWIANQLRGPSGSERQLALLVAGVALVVASRWRLRSTPVRTRRVALRARWSGIRAPPAFG
jgi:hypothetical protein